MVDRRAVFLAAFCTMVQLLLAAGPAQAQQTVVLFDEVGDASADHLEDSDGVVIPPDHLLRVLDRYLPITRDHAHSGDAGGVLEYRHETGSWEMRIGIPGAPVDLRQFDSLIVHVNGPDSILGGELPRVRFEDSSGSRSSPLWLSRVHTVQVDASRSGFSAESSTDVTLSAEYIRALPPERRRPGYPEDLLITFADEPRDTSVEGIGMPDIPVRFSVASASGLPLAFRIRENVDARDNTLSAGGEYIEVLLPEEEGSTTLVPTWRISVDGPGTFADPPGEGDNYRLALTVDAFTLDGDPETWQRVSLPINEILRDGTIAAGEVSAVVFTHGGRNEAVRTLWFDEMAAVRNNDAVFLEEIQELAFRYFWNEANPQNGLVKDRSTGTSPASIAAVGFGLSAITVGIDRGWITRDEGRDRVLTTLEFLWSAPQDSTPNATGYQGFFYHFLDMDTGRRTWNSELSTIDTALLLAGVLHVREYFDGADEQEARIRALSDSIYQRVDWTWMQFRKADNPRPAISHGWRPKSGFIQNDWIGYNEAMILYILALGSPTHPVGPEAWDAWTSGYDWATYYGYSFVRFPPLFGHQYSHVWIDFRGIRDEYMKEKGLDYFENSRRATLAQREYHIQNPKNYPNYGLNEWGLTASDTPTGYRARGAPPPQNDDGTIAPTAPGGSIVFTPNESIAALRTMKRKYPALWGPYGFRDAYNVTKGWFDSDYIGIDQGPIVLMIENYRTGAILERMMRHEAIQLGLERAGFIDFNVATEEDAIPEPVVRLAVYPNPTSGTLNVVYELDAPGRVSLSCYDVLGRRVALLHSAAAAPGTHHTETDLSHVSSGTYFIVLETSGAKTIQPITILR